MALSLYLLVLLLPSALALFGLGADRSRSGIKSDILTLARKVKRGLTETPEERTKMLLLFDKLEKLNPTRKTLASPLTSGVWVLEYTTSDSINGKKDGFDRIGPILQSLDVAALTACNEEVVDYKLAKVSRKVTASLKPVSPTKVAVQFEQFTIAGFLKFKAPSSFAASLDITYVDSDLRLSRGDKGNIFILTKAT
jgi:hypothetical protein